MYTKQMLFALLMALTAAANAQQFTLSGYLRDEATGEELLYATVAVPALNDGVTTNEYGFYSLTLPAGEYEVTYSYVGYANACRRVALNQNMRLDVALSSGAVALQEVVVTAEDPDQHVQSTQMSVNTIDLSDAKLLPVLFGEQDILKTIQLLPGVSSGSEGSTGFYVRGGDADQNLVLLDEAPVYNASHLLGFFSVFNSDALKDVKLYKGGIPAQYGGRVSSVLDIRMKNGNNQDWTAAGGIGLIASRLTVEGPLTPGRGSVMVSGRRTYADLLLKGFSNDFDETSLYFYDLNAKANYTLGDNDRLYLSGYFGRDVFSLNQAGLDWGNATGTLRWNHVFSDKLFLNTSLIYSDFNYGFKVDNAGTAIRLNSGIYNYNLKQDFNAFLNPRNTVQFGWNMIRHEFKPGAFSTEGESNMTVDLAPQQAIEAGFYLDNEQKLSKRWSVYYGLRLSSFSNVGEAAVKTYNEEDEVVRTEIYGKGEVYHHYFRFEPRANATWLLKPDQSLKFSYNRSAQYIHLLSNATSGTPTDLWIPSTPLVRPEMGDQWAAGYFRSFNRNAYEISVEAYYKLLSDLVEYEDGADAFLNPDLEAELVFGQGRAYGAEFFVKKNQGALTGWISYTLSRSERQFDAINEGEWFSARQDRTHNLSVVASYQLSPKLTLSGAWVYYTGDAVTFPVGKYEIDGEIITLYGDRNANRMPDYHRLDLGLTWVIRDRAGWYSDLNFSVYNVYNRKNAFSIDFRENEITNSSEAVQTALFGIVPAVTWNFKF